MPRIFLGKPFHWLLWIVIVGVLFLAGDYKMHVRLFNGFIFVVLALGVASVAAILASYAEGDRITREPFDDAQ